MESRRKKLIGLAGLGVFFSSILLIACYTGYSFALIPEMFRLNKVCQEEGYYMAEFEFKMLGLAYYLDKGRYVKALSGIQRLHHQLKTRKGLSKLPEFKNEKQELAFYLNQQNPRTGAFIDDDFPIGTYLGPTQNVLEHISALAQEIGEPLRLKYPLKFLDEINTPPKLKAFLNDVSHVGWIASKMPQTTFHQTRDILDFCNDRNIITKNKLYTFSSDWKMALLQWFYENQDPETGFWGPRSRRNGKLWRPDLNNTASIVKDLARIKNNNFQKKFPLRYKKEMVATALKVLSNPIPPENETAKCHEWALATRKGFKMLLSYLWDDASAQQKAEAKILMQSFAKLLFEKYYIASEGAFAYYPGARHATIDGTGVIDFFKGIGAFSRKKQNSIWNLSAHNAIFSQSFNIEKVTPSHLEPLLNRKEINSIRLYAATPDEKSYTSNPACIFYPRKTPYLDVVDLVPRVVSWLNSTDQSMGNWTSKETTKEELSSLLKSLKSTRIIQNDTPTEVANELLKSHHKLTAIGFDILQVPKYQITFSSK